MDLPPRRAIVVAHPDDETMWFSGLMIRHPGDWAVICCSIPRRDPERAWKFFAACNVLGAKGLLRPYVEPAPDAEFETLAPVDLSGFDLVVTHNVGGEYGNAHHMSVHELVLETHPLRMLVSGYGFRLGRDEPELSIALTPDEMDRKLAALRCYDHTTPIDGKPKWQALLDRYGSQFDLATELYDRP